MQAVYIHVVSPYAEDIVRFYSQAPYAPIKEQYTNRIIDKLEAYAPNVKVHIIGRHVFSLEDLQGVKSIKATTFFVEKLLP